MTKPKWVGGFATRAEAEAARDDARVAKRHGSYVAPDRMLVRDYLDDWLAGRASKLKPSTLLSYRRDLHRYVIPRVGGDRLQELSGARLEVLYEELLREGGRDGGALSVRTVRYQHSILRKAFGDAVRLRPIQVNPATMVELPAHPAGHSPVARTDVRAWSADQLRTFVAGVEGEQFSELYVLALNTGLRRGELLGLRWGDVDLAGQRLHVRNNRVRVEKGTLQGTPKSGKTRSFNLDPTSLELLRNLRRRQSEQRLAWPGAWGNDDDLVFTHEEGRPIAPDHATKTFRRLVDGLGLPAIRLHDCRHTFATLALQAGVSPKVVSERLGHATVAFTLDVYGHVLPADDQLAAELFHRHVYG
nr:site-specific integrase [Euzebya pacifica]